MSLNPVTWFSAAAVEADVVTLIAKMKTSAGIMQADLKLAFAWIDANAGTIATDIAEVTKVVATVGLASGNPQISAAVTAANAAVAALNAYAVARQSGQGTAAAALEGYTAVKTMQQTSAALGLAVALAPPATTSAAPAAPVVPAKAS